MKYLPQVGLVNENFHAVPRTVEAAREVDPPVHYRLQNGLIESKPFQAFAETRANEPVRAPIGEPIIQSSGASVDGLIRANSFDENIPTHW